MRVKKYTTILIAAIAIIGLYYSMKVIINAALLEGVAIQDRQESYKIASPITYKDMVGFGCSNGRFYAIDTNTGRMLWQVKVFKWTDYVLKGDLIYFIDGGGSLKAVDIQTGKERLRFQLDSTSVLMPLIAEDRVFQRTNNNNTSLSCLDTDTGEQLWEFKASGHLETDPVLSGGVLCIGTIEGTVYALDAATGKEKWSFKTGDVVSPPNAEGDIFYVGSQAGSIFSGEFGALQAIDAKTSRRKWRFEPTGGVYSPLAISSDTICFGSTDRKVYAVDKSNGRKKWSFKTGCDEIRSAPAIANQTVYFTSCDGYLYAVNLGSGKERWRFDIDDNAYPSQPVAKNNAIFIGSFGSLYSLDANSGKTIWEYKVKD